VVFLKNPSIQRYVVEALKTWRKHNRNGALHAVARRTTALRHTRRNHRELRNEDFSRNPDMDRELYRGSSI